MRRVIAAQACLALLIALYVAPFQHVHLGVDDDDHEAHHHSTIVHSHSFVIFIIPTDSDREPNVTGADDDHKAISLDTYAAIHTSALSPVFLPGSRVVLFHRAERLAPVELVEVRGHDPPSLVSSPPRAPPA